MITEEAIRDFRFKSSLVATMIVRGFGAAIIWGASEEFFAGWLRPSWDRLPYMLILLPFGLLACFAGGYILFNAREIEIEAGRLRFRRLFEWNSIPLESISKIRLLPAPGAYIRADHEGKRYRIVFTPVNYSLRHRPLSVIKFLRKVREMNADRQGKHK